MGTIIVNMKSHKAPGKNYRKGLSIKKLFKMFPDDAEAEAWFVKQRWPNGVACPHCGSVNVQEYPREGLSEHHAVISPHR